MLSKVNKDNPIFISSLLYFVPTPPPPAYFDPPPHLLIFWKPWSSPVILTPPSFIMNPRVSRLNDYLNDLLGTRGNKLLYFVLINTRLRWHAADKVWKKQTQMYEAMVTSCHWCLKDNKVPSAIINKITLVPMYYPHRFCAINYFSYPIC